MFPLFFSSLFIWTPGPKRNEIKLNKVFYFLSFHVVFVLNLFTDYSIFRLILFFLSPREMKQQIDFEPIHIGKTKLHTCVGLHPASGKVTRSVGILDAVRSSVSLHHCMVILLLLLNVVVVVVLESSVVKIRVRIDVVIDAIGRRRRFQKRIQSGGTNDGPVS